MNQTFKINENSALQGKLESRSINKTRSSAIA